MIFSVHVFRYRSELRDGLRVRGVYLVPQTDSNLWRTSFLNAPWLGLLAFAYLSIRITMPWPPCPTLAHA